MGGMLVDVGAGFGARKVAGANTRYRRELEEKMRRVVNVGIYEPQQERDVETTRANPGISRRQVENLKRLKEKREDGFVENASKS